MDRELDCDTLSILGELQGRYMAREKGPGDVSVQDVMRTLNCSEARANDMLLQEVAAGRLVYIGEVKATNGRRVKAWRRP